MHSPMRGEPATVRASYVNQGPSVTVSGRVARALWHPARLAEFADRVRGQDAELDQALESIRYAGVLWVRTVSGTQPPGSEEPAREWLTTTEAAQVLRMTGRGVRKAISERRLPARTTSSGFLIAVEDLAQFQARKEAA